MGILMEINIHHIDLDRPGAYALGENTDNSLYMLYLMHFGKILYLHILNTTAEFSMKLSVFI